MAERCPLMMSQERELRISPQCVSKTKPELRSETFTEKHASIKHCTSTYIAVNPPRPTHLNAVQV